MAQEYTMEQVIGVVKAAIESQRSSAPPLPPPIILTGGGQKTGMSSISVTKRILTRKQEAGAPVGALADGSESVDDKVIRIIVEEIMREITENGRITVVIPAGTPITATGVCPVGGVVVQGATVSFTVGTAAIQ